MCDLPNDYASLLPEEEWHDFLGAQSARMREKYQNFAVDHEFAVGDVIDGEKPVLSLPMKKHCLVVAIKVMWAKDTTKIASPDALSYALHRACKINCWVCVQKLVRFNKKDVKLRIRNGGATPLHLAAEANSLESVRVLLDSGADVRVKNRQGAFPIHAASRRSNGIEIVDLLARRHGRRKKVDVRDGRGCTPLITAAASSRLEVVEYLVKMRGASVNASSKGGITALHVACVYGCLPLVNFLCDSGASVDAPEYTSGITPLWMAVKANFREVARLLLTKGADANVTAGNGRAPLHKVAVSGHVEMAKILLEGGADANLCCTKEDDEMTTPLFLAVERDKGCGRRDMCRLLLDHGANVNAADERGLTPLMKAVIRGDEALVEMLCRKEEGCDLNAKDAVNMSALYYAVLLKHRRITKVLVKSGARSDSKSPCGDTLLHLSVAVNRSEMNDYLFVTGADMEPKSASTTSDRDIFDLMLGEYPDDIGATDDMGRTPLNKAARFNYSYAAEKMLAVGNDNVLNSVDSCDLTPLEAAVWCNSLEVAKIILQDSRVDQDDTSMAIPYSLRRGVDARLLSLLLEHGAQLRDSMPKRTGLSYCLLICVLKSKHEHLRILLESGQVSYRTVFVNVFDGSLLSFWSPRKVSSDVSDDVARGTFFHMAKMKKDKDVIDVLQKFKKDCCAKSGRKKKTRSGRK